MYNTRRLIAGLTTAYALMGTPRAEPVKEGIGTDLRMPCSATQAVLLASSIAVFSLGIYTLRRY